MFTLLSHISITYSPRFDFFELKQPERDIERDRWSQYVREFSGFYFDLFVDYI